MGQISIFDQSARRAHAVRIMASALPADARCDANEIMNYVRALEHVQADLVRANWEALKNRELIPEAVGVNAGADSYTWKQYTEAGMAKFVNENANDIPNVSGSATENTTKIRTAATMWAANVLDALKGNLIGLSIEEEGPQAALLAIEQLREQTQWLGDTILGIPGALKNANVPVITSGYTGNWDALATTGRTIILDARKLVATVRSQSRGNFEADTWVCGNATFLAMTTKEHSEFNPITPAEMLLKTTTIKTIECLSLCDLADAGGDGERSMIYKKDPMILRQIAPIDYMELPPEARALRILHHFLAKFGGTIFLRPLGAVYVDGLLDG